MREEGTVWFHAMTTGVEIASSQNIFCMQNCDYIIPANPRKAVVDHQNDILKVASLRLIVGCKLDARYAFQFALVLLVVASVRGDKLV
jgi:hypothetical protein